MCTRGAEWGQGWGLRARKDLGNRRTEDEEGKVEQGRGGKQDCGRQGGGSQEAGKTSSCGERSRPRPKVTYDKAPRNCRLICAQSHRARVAGQHSKGKAAPAALCRPQQAHQGASPTFEVRVEVVMEGARVLRQPNARQHWLHPQKACIHLQGPRAGPRVLHDAAVLGSTCRLHRQAARFKCRSSGTWQVDDGCEIEGTTSSKPACKKAARVP
jgi:hypothetical protein